VPFRDKEEDRRVFWNGIGCIITGLLGLVSCIFIICILVIPVLKDGHVESSVVCPSVLGNIRYELILVQNGLEWEKELKTRGETDSEYDKTLIMMVHNSQMGQFDDVSSVLWCAPRGGLIMRATLKKSVASALFWVDAKKKVHLYGELIP
jgi:hypothetical protein